MRLMLVVVAILLFAVAFGACMSYLLPLSGDGVLMPLADGFVVL